MYDLARPRRCQYFDDIPHERPKIGNPVGSRMHDDNGHTSHRYVLLKCPVSIYRDQVRESCLGHRAEQVAVAASKPAFVSDRGNLDSWKIPAEPLGHALVEQHPHLCCRYPLEQQLLGNLQRGNSLLSSNAREVDQELVERIASFKVFKQSLHGDSSADKDKGPTHDVAVSVKWEIRIRQLSLPRKVPKEYLSLPIAV